jgi:hypothetical protein
MSWQDVCENHVRFDLPDGTELVLCSGCGPKIWCEAVVECDNCRAECGFDEAGVYDLPTGRVVLCLDCGPEENYAELKGTA